MHYHVLTLFPEMIEQGMGTSIMGRAMEQGLIRLTATNIRDFSTNKHMKVDDYPYGGGAGMVMQAEPVYGAWKQVTESIGYKPRVIYLTPQGKVFQQSMVEDFAREQDLVFLCGHYEGIDERVLEEVVTDYVSIGDYVLTGGELPALVMMDAISRFVPGVLIPSMTIFWNIRSTAVRQNGWGKKYRMCCFPVIMRILKSGGESSLSCEPFRTVRNFWKMQY